MRFPRDLSHSSESLPLTRIERTATLSDQVALQLENLIIDQNFSEGDRLPTERALAERFAVSRTVVREAVKGLVSRGVLQVNPGSGTIIRRPTSDIVTQTMTHYLRLGHDGLDHNKITEVRRMLEVDIAGKAAERRTQEDITALKAILVEFEQVQHDKVAYTQWDVSFHLQIARATHNELLHLLLDSISSIMKKVREIGFDVPGATANAFRHHQSIFEQIMAGNVKEARLAMRLHIEESEKVMADAMRSETAIQAE